MKKQTRGRIVTQKIRDDYLNQKRKNLKYLNAILENFDLIGVEDGSYIFKRKGLE